MKISMHLHWLILEFEFFLQSGLLINLSLPLPFLSFHSKISDPRYCFLRDFKSHSIDNHLSILPGLEVLHQDNLISWELDSNHFFWVPLILSHPCVRM